MEKEIAELAMKFMMRAQLTGQEVPAFNAVMQELDAVMQVEAPAPVAPAAPAA